MAAKKWVLVVLFVSLSLGLSSAHRISISKDNEAVVTGKRDVPEAHKIHLSGDDRAAKETDNSSDLAPVDVPGGGKDTGNADSSHETLKKGPSSGGSFGSGSGGGGGCGADTIGSCCSGVIGIGNCAGSGAAGVGSGGGSWAGADWIGHPDSCYGTSIGSCGGCSCGSWYGTPLWGGYLPDNAARINELRAEIGELTTVLKRLSKSLLDNGEHNHKP